MTESFIYLVSSAILTLVGAHTDDTIMVWAGGFGGGLLWATIVEHIVRAHRR